MSINDIIILEKLKQGFKRKIYWNKYRFEITVRPKNKNLNYLIIPKIRKTFVLSFKNDDDDSTRNSSDMYYMSLLETNILMH